MTPDIIAAASRIMDVFMGGHTGWRERMDESGILESADWAHAVRLARAALPSKPDAVTVPFQQRVAPWMQECFGPEISADRVERGDRLLEEVFELLQSGGYDPTRVATLRDYVWGRPIGEPAQEVGGVMVTLAAYCLAFGLDMHEAGETELARILRPEVVEKIRAKQAAKAAAIGNSSPLPIAPKPDAPDRVTEGARLAEERVARNARIERWKSIIDALHFIPADQVCVEQNKLWLGDGYGDGYSYLEQVRLHEVGPGEGEAIRAAIVELPDLLKHLIRDLMSDDERCSIGWKDATTPARLLEENEALREALEWYAEQVAGCRKLSLIGDPFRRALDADGGKRARAALGGETGK